MYDYVTDELDIDIVYGFILIPNGGFPLERLFRVFFWSVNLLGSVMEFGDGSGDARTFRVNFSNAGVSKLREEVREKLKEFMGDYTDDTLVVRIIFI